MDGESFGGGGQRNVLGGVLITCSVDPMTGSIEMDAVIPAWKMPALTLSAVMNDDFLVSKASGNDLSTPRPEFGFDGLKAGDYWCLCAARWEQARQAGLAPQVKLEACNMAALRYCHIDDLKAHALQ